MIVNPAMFYYVGCYMNRSSSEIKCKPSDAKRAIIFIIGYILRQFGTLNVILILNVRLNNTIQ